MARKQVKPTLPPEGVAFAFPLEDGRYSVCRVLRTHTIEGDTSLRDPCVLAVGSVWIGAALPDVQDPALRPILHLTHHAWKNEPLRFWISDPVPSDFVLLGTIDPTPEEQAIPCLKFGFWRSITGQVLRQWQWDHDPEAVRAADEAKKAEEAQRRAREQRIRDEYLQSITLEQLAKHRFFPTWKDSPDKEAIRASRQIMKQTVKDLLKLGPDAPEADKLAVLQACIERFNEVDAELDHFIDTLEREDICEEFEAIVHACGMGAHKDLEDEWREW